MKVKKGEVNRETRCKSGRSYNRSCTSSNTKEGKLQVKIVQTEISAKSQEISDGGKRLIFRRHDLPIHRFVADRHHGEVELGVLASDLLQGGVEPEGWSV